MLRLRTAVLRHDCRTGTHFDLLIEDPTTGRPGVAALWAARVPLPPAAWSDDVALRLAPLPAHRRRYLTYQGPLTGGRGTVRRIDSGHCLPLLWTGRRIVLDCRVRGFEGRLDLVRRSPSLWLGGIRRGFCGQVDLVPAASGW